MQVYEVEMKFPVNDLDALRQRLVALAARFHDPVDQVDLYFAHPSRDFAQTDEALRLRRVGHDAAITWKGPRIGTAAKTRREIELPLEALPVSLPGGAPTTIDRWTELLEALGFRRAIEVVKRRLPASVQWQGVEVQIALDTVAGLGDFVELELLAAEGELSLAQERVSSLARRLGCGPQERRSYLEMLLS
jgi:adenylate cyclase class 2